MAITNQFSQWQRHKQLVADFKRRYGVDVDVRDNLYDRTEKFFWRSYRLPPEMREVYGPFDDIETMTTHMRAVFRLSDTSLEPSSFWSDDTPGRPWEVLYR